MTDTTLTSPTPDSSDTRVTTTVVIPADPSGSALAVLIRDARLAILRGDVRVDTRGAAGWSPGPRMVLDRLARMAERAGRRWDDVALAPSPSS